MSIGKCQYCGERAAFAPCMCGEHELLKCAKGKTCAECQSAHRLLAKFFKTLLATRLALRSDSARRKLLAILHDTTSGFLRSNGQENRDVRFALDCLNAVTAWDAEPDFRGSIRRAIPALPLSRSFLFAIRERLLIWDAERKASALAAAANEIGGDFWSQLNRLVNQERATVALSALISKAGSPNGALSALGREATEQRRRRKQPSLRTQEYSEPRRGSVIASFRIWKNPAAKRFGWATNVSR
jgi:hypothetical protein